MELFHSDLLRELCPLASVDVREGHLTGPRIVCRDRRFPRAALGSVGFRGGYEKIGDVGEDLELFVREAHYPCGAKKQVRNTASVSAVVADDRDDDLLSLDLEARGVNDADERLVRAARRRLQIFAKSEHLRNLVRPDARLQVGVGQGECLRQETVRDRLL